MKLQDYLLAVTVGMLSCDEGHLASAKKAMEGGSLDYHFPVRSERSLPAHVPQTGR